MIAKVCVFKWWDILEESNQHEEFMGANDPVDQSCSRKGSKTVSMYGELEGNPDRAVAATGSEENFGDSKSVTVPEGICSVTSDRLVQEPL